MKAVEMTKAQIVETVLKDFWDHSAEHDISRGNDDAYYETTIIDAVGKSLKLIGPNTDIRTCEDFGHLNVKYCDNCHGLYQHFEVSLMEIESGGNAWICCSLDRALNPMTHANYPKLPENCTFDAMLAEFIKWSEDAK